MAHGKDAARDLRYGRRGGRWAEAPTPSMEELREAHAETAPKNCRCVWCTETEPDAEAAPSLFDPKEP